MFDIGFWEIMMVVLVALVAVRPDRLPEIARAAGTWMRRLRAFVETVKSEVNRELNQGEGAGSQELQELRREFSNLRHEFSRFSRESQESWNREILELEKQGRSGEPADPEDTSEEAAAEESPVEADSAVPAEEQPEPEPRPSPPEETQSPTGASDGEEPVPEPPAAQEPEPAPATRAGGADDAERPEPRAAAQPGEVRAPRHNGASEPDDGPGAADQSQAEAHAVDYSPGSGNEPATPDENSTPERTSR